MRPADQVEQFKCLIARIEDVTDVRIHPVGGGREDEIRQLWSWTKLIDRREQHALGAVAVTAVNPVPQPATELFDRMLTVVELMKLSMGSRVGAFGSDLPAGAYESVVCGLGPSRAASCRRWSGSSVPVPSYCRCGRRERELLKNFRPARVPVFRNPRRALPWIRLML